MLPVTEGSWFLGWSDEGDETFVAGPSDEHTDVYNKWLHGCS